MEPSSCCVSTSEEEMPDLLVCQLQCLWRLLSDGNVSYMNKQGTRPGTDLSVATQAIIVSATMIVVFHHTNRCTRNSMSHFLWILCIDVRVYNLWREIVIPTSILYSFRNLLDIHWQVLYLMIMTEPTVTRWIGIMISKVQLVTSMLGHFCYVTNTSVPSYLNLPLLW